MSCYYGIYMWCIIVGSISFHISCHQLEAETIQCSELAEKTLYLLNSSVVYTINNSNEELCVIRDHDLMLQSNTSNSARIHCNDASGIVFINSTITIERVSFIECGANLMALDDTITDLFDDSHSLNITAAMFFINSKLNARRLTMKSSIGYAVIGYNLKNSTLSQSNFILGQRENKTEELGGLFILFSKKLNSSKHVSIQGCNFSNSDCRNDKLNGNHTSTAVKIVYMNTTHQAHVIMNGTRFHMDYSGCMHGSVESVEILQNTSKHCKTHIEHCTFLTSSKKSQIITGVKFDYYIYANFSVPVNALPLLISSSVFNKNRHSKGLLLKIRATKSKNITVTVQLSNVIFSNGITNISGSCMKVDGKFRTKVKVILESVKVLYNNITSISPIYPLNLLSFSGVTCIINGTKDNPSNFIGNNGTVIYGVKSNIMMKGIVQFSNNYAFNGPAIYVEGNSRIFFMNDGKSSNSSRIVFQENKAISLGGAVYAVLPNSNNYKHCAFYIPSETSWVRFAKNTARDGGSSIYASPIFNCKFNRDKILPANKALDRYKKLFKFTGSSRNVFHLSTTSADLKLSNHIQDRRFYPGEEFTYCIYAIDAAGRHVFTHMKLDVLSTDLWLMSNSTYNTIQEGKTCTNLTFSLRSSKKTVASTLFFSLPCRSDAFRTVNVTITDCPIGFSLNAESGSCICSNALKTFSESESRPLTCNIQSQTFARSSNLYHNSWAGLVGEKFAISTFCLIGQCTTDERLGYFYSANKSTLVLKDSQESNTIWPICNNGREGPLCGKCKEGLSHVFGSVKCMDCSSNLDYWLLIGVILVGGVLIVLFLYALNITLSSGTINGVIFYANVMNISLVNLLELNNQLRVQFIAQKMSAFFLAVINLNSIFPVCFFKTMNPMWKIGIGMFFEYYLLLIVLAVIVISRYSTWLSNRTSHSSVQVLVTLVHISISTLLSALIKVFSSVTLYMDERTIRVWLYDGSIRFLEDSNHLILVAVISVAVLPLFTTYVLFLLFMRYFLKLSSKLNMNSRQISEAIYAPFKPGKEHWFVARLLLLALICVLPISMVSLTHVYLITALLTLIFLSGHVLFHPFKNKALNTLDNWALLNVAGVYGGVLLCQGDIERAALVLTCSATMMFFTFIGIIVYHFLVVSKLLPKIKSLIFKTRFKRYFESRIPATTPSFTTCHTPLKPADSYYESCNEWREPLQID